MQINTVCLTFYASKNPENVSLFPQKYLAHYILLYYIILYYINKIFNIDNSKKCFFLQH